MNWTTLIASRFWQDGNTRYKQKSGEGRKMRKPPQPIILLILAILFLNSLCMGASSKKSISPDQILAKVNGEPVTVSMFYDHLRKSNITTKNPEEDKKSKEKSLRELMREMLIDQKTALLDMESDTTFVMLRDRHMHGWLLDYMYKVNLEETVEVSSQEVKDHYDEFREIDFLIPEEVRVRDLLLAVWADSTKKDYSKRLKRAEKEAKEKIQEVYQKVEQGEEFLDLCRQYTHTSIPSRTGDLGFIQRGQKTPEFEQAAFSLETIGEISEPFKDKHGYHLVQLLDRKEKSYLELDEVLYERIKAYLVNQKLAEVTALFVDSLLNEAQLVYNMEVLNSEQPVVDKSVWVLTFSQNDTIRYEDFFLPFSNFKFEAGLDSVGFEHKKFFLDKYLALPVILQREAEKRGYADLVEYRVELRAFTFDAAKRKFTSTRIRQDFPPATREELEEYYRDHKIDFPPLGVPVHVHHIVFDDSVKAAEVLSQIREGEDFVKMARLYFPGDQEMRDVAYDLGFITQGEMPDEFYQAALNLKIGETSEPVKTMWGFHLIQVVERKEEETKFEDITIAIQRALDVQKARQHMADWEEALFNDAEVWTDKKLLEEIELPKPEG
jgi:parvulin-like peptidyl-prolyl isomerase